MTTALVVSSSIPGRQDLAADLQTAGIHVLGAVDWGNLVQEASRCAPDVVVAQEASATEAMFESAALLLAGAPRPVLLFVSDPDADRIDRALACGVAAYVVNGYGAPRLRPLIHLAQARFRQQQQLRNERDDMAHRFEERKLVDRAKGILMRARQVSEEEAFHVLRAASMHSNRRVGQVSQQVIDAARYAEAVNRAGQLRMLSQRLVKLYALQALGVPVDGAPLAETSSRVASTLSALAKSLSTATYGDLIDAVAQPWTTLKAALDAPVDRTRLGEIDALAERVLLHADRLTMQLENSGLAASLHVINVSGRQRMLSQRLAKQALLGVLLKGEAAADARAEADKAKAEFEQALTYLNGIPLSTRDIQETLVAAGSSWGEMVQALARVRSAPGQRLLGESSEALLGLFEQLTERYERSMQMLIG